nr:ribosomal protein L32 [Chloroidium sp. KL-2023a]
MAVPKKRTSKSKKNIRKANWKNKGFQQTKKALSLVIVALSKSRAKPANRTIDLGLRALDK